MQEYIISPYGNKYYTEEYVDSLREENLSAKAGATEYNKIPQKGFQEKVLVSDADIMVIGGKRGGGKSRIMNTLPVYNIDVVGFNANGFRKEEEDVRDGLFKDAVDLYRGFGDIIDLSIRFNDGAASIDYSHIQNEKEADRRFRGRQMPCILIDELSQFQESTFFTLLGSNRNTLGIRNKFVASTNPVGDKHWLYQLVKWYIDPISRRAIPERSGVIRYFYRHGSKLQDIIWGF
jgi:hypothetical protein